MGLEQKDIFTIFRRNAIIYEIQERNLSVEEFEKKVVLVGDRVPKEDRNQF